MKPLLWLSIASVLIGVALLIVPSSPDPFVEQKVTGSFASAFVFIGIITAVLASLRSRHHHLLALFIAGLVLVASAEGFFWSIVDSIFETGFRSRSRDAGLIQGLLGIAAIASVWFTLLNNKNEK